MFKPGTQPVGMIPPQEQFPEIPTSMNGQFQEIEGHMNPEYQEVRTIMVDGGDRYGVSTTSFDAQEELLWMGNQGGHVTSYYGMELQKYTSFKVHNRSDVRQILTLDGRILSLAADDIRCSTKFGRRVSNFSNPNMVDMQCMLLTSPGSVLMGGHQNVVMELDLASNMLIREMEVEEHGYAILRRTPHFICAGDTTGKVRLMDPKTLKMEHVLDAHSGTLSDFDVHGHTLVTCGFSNRMGNLTVDRFLMVYDLRVMRALSPLQLLIDPMFLRFVPTYVDRICVVSQTGQFQLLEQGALSSQSMFLYQVDTQGSPLMTFDISSSCQAMSFGDNGGYLHLFSSGESAVFNPFSTPTEFPHVEHLPPININDEITPLSIIPMQYPTNGKLLSDWPEQWTQRMYRKPELVEPDILRSMKIVQNVGYAPNPGNRRRNQMPYKMKKSSNQRDRKANVPDSPIGRGDDPFVVVPKKYRKVEVKYSKLGLEDFDFRHYNKTNFAGLETHIPNAYCNAMLQVLYFNLPLRVSMLNHVCEKEFCLSCELGFLFFMLDGQKGGTCQANNFLRAFRTIPEAQALGLTLGEAEESTGKVNLARLIQSWNRFILQQTHSELIEAEKERMQKQDSEEAPSDQETKPAEGETAAENKPPEEPIEEKESVITNLFSTEVVNTFTCRCGEKIVRSVMSSIFDLNYPDCFPEGSAQDPLQFSFADIVQHSLSLEQQTQAWCNSCDRYQPHIHSKEPQRLPDVLSLNCHLDSLREWEFWKTQQELLQPKDIDSSMISSASSTPSNVRPCRYGNRCTRKDCRFRHERDESALNELNFVLIHVQSGELVWQYSQIYQIQMENNTGFSEMDSLDMSRLADDSNAVSWIPEGIRLHLAENGMLTAQNVEEGVTYVDGSIEYELYATVSHIQDHKTGGNLVSHVKVGSTYHKHKENVSCTQWYLFNDFSITPIESNEATYFNLEWHIPCTIYYIRRDLLGRYPLKVDIPITQDALFQNASLVTPRRKHVTFTPLDDSELPTPGDIIGLDAEFVTLNQEEAELRSDGTRSTIKPSQMSVARISCVRGQGPLEGEPFIDDYISTSEQVVDYLTQFSGIQPGDLDASISSKHLTTLKTTYLKLRHLVDRGVIFVGHGLKKDFRVINMVVPQAQVMDTVELFHLPRQRMISLRFLAWHFMGLNIQSVTHDSVEDARTALKLYKKYQELQAAGPDTVREAIKEMYEKGRKLGWKVPEDTLVTPITTA